MYVAVSMYEMEKDNMTIRDKAVASLCMAAYEQLETRLRMSRKKKALLSVGHCKARHSLAVVLVEDVAIVVLLC